MTTRLEQENQRLEELNASLRGRTYPAPWDGAERRKPMNKQAAMALDCALPVALYAFAKTANAADIEALFASLRDRLIAQGFVTEEEIDEFLEPLRSNVEQMRELIGEGSK